ncbi:DUF397 domain-containing protein [Saccharopolyspora pogona]|uniref:DUF397 domain-containing protein n=1 Tax=Saccharopolyspora pogona TaxID=333966 RepID=UPI001688948C|nr:DUF397 domain-containing protein [Saccharopolyspora pogona]
MNLSRVSWRKSSYSGGGNACVEIGVAPAVVGVRDTKDRSYGTLAVTPERFADFLTAIKAGKLER